MSIAPAGVHMETLQRLRMSWDEYLALPEKPKAEWVDGEVVVSPSPTIRHQLISRRVSTAIEHALPDLRMILA